MKKKKTYQEEVEKLCKSIDISIDSFTTHPPKSWTPDIVKMVISDLEKDKLRRMNTEPKFRTLASLKYDVEAVFTYFQEGSGETVEYFWNKIRQANLDFERENKLKKILNRGKIRNRLEYEYVTDMIVVSEQIGMTSETETKILNKILDIYESKKKNN
jgi:hypothetical protein